MELDALDQLAAEAFDGYIVRKDLALKFSGQYPVPTYVGEFLLGRYCATTDEEEIDEGLEIVERQMRERTVRAGEEELFKSRAREQGEVKLIDLITARLDAKTDSYLATLPSLRLTDVRIDPELVAEQRAHADRRLLRRDRPWTTTPPSPRRRTAGPSASTGCGRSSSPSATCWRTSRAAASAFTDGQWKHLLLRSIGIEPDSSRRAPQDVLLLRMVPFVERNYNMVELGPRGTGKCHLFQQVSPYAHLISGGKATVARMFVNNATGQRGLVCQYDVVCFDEISGVSFDQKDGVNIMKGYMESGEFSRGKESIRADGCIVLVGNFDVDVEHQQRIGHLFGPLPKEMRDDTAFMDRIHAYLPGWDVPKMDRSLFTDPLRPGQRLPLRVLDPAAERRTGCRHPGPGSATAARSAAATPTPSTRRSTACSSCSTRTARCPLPTRIWSGPCAWPWNAGAGSRSSRSASAPPSSATPTSATAWATTASSSSSSRRSSRARTPSAPIRCRRARSGPSARAGWTSIPASTASRSTRPGLGRQDRQQARARAVPGEHAATPSRTCYARQGARGRPRPAPARVHRPAAGLRRRQERRLRWGCRRCLPCARRCWRRASRAA